MKRLLQFLVIMFPLALLCQPNTEVYLFDLDTTGNQISISNGKNISNNEGYDNQPSFKDDNTLLFAATRNAQTDVLSYSIRDEIKKWLTDTKQGSEYSPTQIPKSKKFSAIRLDTTGKQFLYRYHKEKSKALLKDLVIGYYVWNSDNILASFVLGEPNILILSNFRKNTHPTIDTNIGRSLHNIPNSNLISYIKKKKEEWEIRSLNPKTGETKRIATTVPNVEDMCWLADGSILMGKGKALYHFDPKKDAAWKIIKLFDTEAFDNITRIAVNEANNKIAIVAEPETTLEPKLENIRWIAGNWKGEAFGGITEENWSEPSGGSMMATFKLIVDGKVNFYEIETISEVNNSLLLCLKHFNNDLKGWETKDETVDFPLIRVTKNKAIFEGMTFESTDEHNMIVYVAIGQKDGTTAIVPFHYTKSN
ncbi:DUF6265 family protein [Kordia jejudonensis]|uniref:DUF6265 family protein n=1 Tax=Kordia jejudonensis TaxID=1348245 RepID=UPI001F4CDD56|nr:DUF6265 family protein [Kordia jejudonensis]